MGISLNFYGPLGAETVPSLSRVSQSTMLLECSKSNNVRRVSISVGESR